MAVRGRKPKPTGLKILEGETDKRRINTAEPKSAGAPVCPEWLEEEAKEEWNRIGDTLEKMGILTDIDTAAFAGYCQTYARWKEAEEYLTNHGSTIETKSGYVQQVPQVSIAQTNLKVMLKFCEQFGLTPSARSRIVADKSVEETTDDMEMLLRDDEE